MIFFWVVMYAMGATLIAINHDIAIALVFVGATLGPLLVLTVFMGFIIRMAVRE